ncbi:MAG TPA: response regulator [Desulfuromonadales bacterium]|nr:response regulator [Desulfuromonadales bacterium]
MTERRILIADKDPETRQRMADLFAETGIPVETTGSATRVLSDILQQQSPLVLLGAEFDENVAAADLIRLLKNCNRHLSIILIANNASLPSVRKFRQEGIFYHALKPVSSEDEEEICSAVECAFKSSPI